MIRMLTRRYLLIQNDGLTRLSVPVGRYWTRAGAYAAKAAAAREKRNEGHSDGRYAWRVATR